MRVDWPELCGRYTPARGMADHVVELALMIALEGQPLEPVGIALVELGTGALQDAVVRGVADERVVEAKVGAVPLDVWLLADEPLPCDRREILGHLVLQVRRQIADRDRRE